MKYLLKFKNNSIIVEDDRCETDTIILPNEITKFRYKLWLNNPNVAVYYYKNSKWNIIFDFPYNKLYEINKRNKKFHSLYKEVYKMLYDFTKRKDFSYKYNLLKEIGTAYWMQEEIEKLDTQITKLHL